jgi:predicted nuclease of predicted toxin-antitoxin system
MKILLDMNLPPAWVDFLENKGIEAIYWSNVGSHKIYNL